MSDPWRYYERSNIQSTNEAVIIHDTNIEPGISDVSILRKCKERKNHYHCETLKSKTRFYLISAIFFVLIAWSSNCCHISVTPRFCSKNTVPLISILDIVRAINGLRSFTLGVPAVNNATSWRETPVYIVNLHNNKNTLCTRIVIVGLLSSSIRSIAFMKNLCMRT